MVSKLRSGSLLRIPCLNMLWKVFKKKNPKKWQPGQDEHFMCEGGNVNQADLTSSFWNKKILSDEVISWCYTSGVKMFLYSVRPSVEKFANLILEFKNTNSMSFWFQSVVLFFPPSCSWFCISSERFIEALCFPCAFLESIFKAQDVDWKSCPCAFE